MAKQQRALVTREQILRAAGEVFAGSGYHRASVDDIIARSGMTKGAMYFHFSRKAAIAEALLARLRDAHPIAAADYPVRLQALITLFNGYAAPPATDPILRGALRLALEQEFKEYEGGEWQEQLQRTISGLLIEAADAGELLGDVEAGQGSRAAHHDPGRDAPIHASPDRWGGRSRADHHYVAPPPACHRETRPGPLSRPQPGAAGLPYSRRSSSGAPPHILQ